MHSVKNWEDLQYFLAVAHKGTLSAAAESLEVSHTTVYRRLRAFETELGTRLFEKVSHRYALTPVGQQLLQRLDGVESKLGRITRELAGLDQRISGPLVIATPDDLGFTVFPEMLAAFAERYPEVDVELKAGTSTLNLAQRQADIAVRPSSSPPDTLIGKRVAMVGFGLFCHKHDKHALGFKGSFEGHRVIGLGPAWFGRAKRWFDARLEGEHIQRLDTDSFLMAARLCEAGLGIALLPDYLADYFQHLHRLCDAGGKAAPPDDQLSSQLWILFHRDLMKSARVRAASTFFWRALREYFSEDA